MKCPAVDVNLKDVYGRRLLRVGEHFVTFSIGVVSIEADNENIQRYPNQKFTLYAIYQGQFHEKTKTTNIVVEDVPGTSLLALWSSLSVDEKAAIATELRTLWQLQHPG